MATNRRNKPVATVKLTDEQVIEIVRVLGRFKARDIAPDGTVREISALDQPALAPLVMRVAELRVVALAENRSLYLSTRAAYATSTHGTGTIAAMRLCVSDRAQLLGHTPIMQKVAGGFQVECCACGATGAAHDDFIGAVFNLQCGTTAALGAALTADKVTP